MTNQPEHAETHTYWISIGRNVGLNPLPDGDWEWFRASIYSTVERHGGEVLSTVNGTSSWAGVDEDTYLVLATIPAWNVRNVRNVLSALVRLFEQDAIGFVGGPGTDTLIRP